MISMELPDHLGVALFAATASFAALRKQLDLMVFMLLAATTGIGGGTARDLITGVEFFWVWEPAWPMPPDLLHRFPTPPVQPPHCWRTASRSDDLPVTARTRSGVS